MSFRSGFVTLLGKPNTGKSTLLNALVGAKVAIVSAKPQTTRTYLQGVLTREQAQIIFVDTPGTHRPLSRLNREMMGAVQQALEGVDLILLVVDASREPSTEDKIAVELARTAQRPSFLVLNKIDRMDKRVLLPRIEHYRRQFDFAEYIPVSALRRENLSLLEQKTIEYLPEGPRYFPPDALTDQPERFVAAERVREKLFQEMREEVPYATAVVVEKYEEGERLVRIHATIFVERVQQKGIVIGAQGLRLKRVGRAARVELEQLLGRKVYLELFVKTREGWQDREEVRRLIDWRQGSV